MTQEEQDRIAMVRESAERVLAIGTQIWATETEIHADLEGEAKAYVIHAQRCMQDALGCIERARGFYLAACCVLRQEAGR